MNSKRIDKLIKFLKEIEKFKLIERQTYLSSFRQENDAEHSWHVALFVILFEKDFPGLDMAKMLKMALIHDLVEIYAGDTFSFDNEAVKSKDQREQKAAKKLFGMLPNDLKKEFHHLFREYDDRKTREALYTQSFDKLLPVVQNLLSHGKAWREYHITEKNVNDHKLRYHRFDKKMLSIFKKLISEVSQKKYFGKESNARQK